MFMITASVILSSISTVVLCLLVCIDDCSRLRLDRVIPVKKFTFTWANVKDVIVKGLCCCFHKKDIASTEQQPLLH